MYLLVIFFCVMILYGIKIAKRKVFFSNVLNYHNSLAIRGICAIEIMLGHIGIRTESIWLFPFRKAGILFVGIFLLLSGYGLIYSLENKTDYLNSFLLKRVGAIFIPAYFVYLLGGFCSLNIDKVSGFQVLKYIFLFKFFENNNWYIFEILGFYFLFYILYKNLHRKTANIVLVVITFLFVIIAFLTGVDAPWYGSTLCFPLGVIYGQYQNQFDNMLKKNYLFKIIACSFTVFGFILLFFVTGEGSFWGDLVARNIASTVFSVLILLILFKVKLGKVFCLGGLSYEIFLIHFWILDFFLEFQERSLCYAVLCIIFTILCALALKKINKVIFSSTIIKTKYF